MSYEDKLLLLTIFIPGWGEFGTDLFDVGVGFVLFFVVTIVLFGGPMLEADWFGLFDFLTANWGKVSGKLALRLSEVLTELLDLLVNVLSSSLVEFLFVGETIVTNWRENCF